MIRVVSTLFLLAAIPLLALLAIAPAAAATEALPQSPYVVKRGDTLWGIAQRFLGRGERWREVWAGNRQINDPNLIMPGDYIHFRRGADGSLQLVLGKRGTTDRVPRHPKVEYLPEKSPRMLPVVSLKPKITYSEPVREQATEGRSQLDFIQLIMKRQNLIQGEDEKTPGRIVTGLNDRLNLSRLDEVLLEISEPVSIGQTFEIYHKGERLYTPYKEELPDPEKMGLADHVTKYTKLVFEGHVQHLDKGEYLGRILSHTGTLTITRNTKEGPVGRITRAFKAIFPGDLLLTPRAVNTDFDIIIDPIDEVTGKIIHIPNSLESAGGNQVAVVNVGRRDRAIQGLRMSVIRAGRVKENPLKDAPTDPIETPRRKHGQKDHAIILKQIRERYVEQESKVNLPTKTVGYATLFYIGEKASLAVLDEVTEPVLEGDTVQALPLEGKTERSAQTTSATP